LVATGMRDRVWFVVVGGNTGKHTGPAVREAGEAHIHHFKRQIWFTLQGEGKVFPSLFTVQNTRNELPPLGDGDLNRFFRGD